MERRFFAWVAWFVFLLIVDCVVPFSIMRDIPGLKGSFLFWVLWIITAIISMFVIFLRWQDHERLD